MDELRLTPSQRATISNALFVARCQYERDRDQMRKTGFERLAEQFEKQIVEVDQVKRIIDE